MINLTKMNTKPPFEAEHNSVCAYPDIPILEFYHGYYECVYLILHPFDEIPEQGKVPQFVTWEAFTKLCGFKDLKQLDIALRNYINGLVAKYKNDADVEILKATCERHGLQIPSEGEFQDALAKDMLNSLQGQGHSYMFIADEHGFERKLVYIQEVIDDTHNLKYQISGHDNWYTNKHEILYTTHWDSFFTLLCSDKATVESILAKHSFEGFYCDPTTVIYWSVMD
jgi:Protein of unknown function (DUF2711)